MRTCLAAVALALLLSAALQAEEDVPGIKVGETAPALEGKWVTKDGKTPDLKGKVYLVDFWFEG